MQVISYREIYYQPVSQISVPKDLQNRAFEVIFVPVAHLPAQQPMLEKETPIVTIATNVDNANKKTSTSPSSKRQAGLLVGYQLDPAFFEPLDEAELEQW